MVMRTFFAFVQAGMLRLAQVSNGFGEYANNFGTMAHWRLRHAVSGRVLAIRVL